MGTICSQGIEKKDPEKTPTISKGTKRFRALFDYSAINEGDLSFKKGDHVDVEESQLDKDWWIAKHVKTKKKGYIPCNYVAEDDGSPQCQDWWYDFDRRESDKMLLLAGNPPGTFLVRESSDMRSYVLSVRDEDVVTTEPSVKHYKIKHMDNGRLYIKSRTSFQTLMDLIEHYRANADGLCIRLTEACPKYRPVVTFRELEIERTAIELLNIVGSGFFGKVYRGKLRNVVDVAVKVLKPGQMSGDSFLDEAKMMHELNHRRLVSLFHVCTLSEPYYIVTEFMENGSLLKYLRSDDGKKLAFDKLVEMAAQIADGMKYLEEKNYIHRDLRADNILVDEHCDVKVADFGLARVLEETIYDASETTKFPIKWTAPEAANYRKFSVKSDVWSYGVLLYEIITYGKQPYPGMNGKETLNFVERGGRMEKPTECPDEFYEVMLSCWKGKPDERSTFEHLFHTMNDYDVSKEPEYLD